jgi:hypothetical protein
MEKQMKIGSSLSRCVKDIYKGTVHIDEVLVVIARTDFDPENDQQWTNIWEGYAGGNALGSMYSQPEWMSIPAEDEQKVRDICINLKRMGKLHQPRQFGARPTRLHHYWYDVILTADVVNSNPAAKRAWDNYKMIADLS